VRRCALGLAVAFIVVTAAGCGGDTVTETTTVTVTGPASPSSNRTFFGHISSLVQEGGKWQMRFDPEWFLLGETANVAAAEDGAVQAGEPVPNDIYTVDESHRLYTFRVPDDAHVTVLTRHGTGQFGATPVTVAELAKIVDGTSTVKLFEPLESGIWLTVDIDEATSIEQQYRP
jgi:hypothetical protein